MVQIIRNAKELAIPVHSLGDHLKPKMIWCAVIMLKRPKTGEVWGEVEWCDIYLFDEWLERSYTCHLLMNLHMKT